MSVVGSLIFCKECGNLLDNIISAKQDLRCAQCAATYPSADFEKLEVTKHSAESAFPSRLRQKRSVVKASYQEDEQEGATIKETCPQCGKDEMQYYSLQLRSADEGATIFYSCTDCGYKFNTNN
ncbi:uncharacterized protein V1510DRAFT_415749 [Dipodascopsis tothii]|uniref:uncharacterized protein n=1 Tax=Dipodascopsis tothii TaxID=44089 RepID=UPI0034CFE8EA